MVIGHKHKFLFIEIPLTGSWSIHNELCTHYGGESILHKHASFAEFKRSPYYREISGDYFVFAAVRNPLDEVVSRYTKLLTDHKGAFTREANKQDLKSEPADWVKFDAIQRLHFSFTEYFARFHRRVYSSMVDLSAENLDYVLRFEDLQSDFSNVLAVLKVEQIRPLPALNRTVSRKTDWRTYYTPEIIPLAVDICGPFMERWGYEFPPEWNASKMSISRQLEYRSICLLRRMYFTHFRYDEGFAGLAARKLRAQLFP